MQSEDNTSAHVRESAQDKLNELLQKLFELSVIVYDFQPDGNKLVWKKMYKHITYIYLNKAISNNIYFIHIVMRLLNIIKRLMI